MPRENDLEGMQDQGGKHGGQKGMPKPEPRPATRSEPRPGVLAIKASCVTSGDRSSRATKSALSKSAEQIRSDDELSRNRVFGGSERACYPILLKEMPRLVRSGYTCSR
jgi:hypothetical protein